MARRRVVEAPAAVVPKKKGKTADEKRLHAVADRFKAFRPARDVLTEVRAVPTDLIQLDHATRVGGWPIERACTIHGPSNQGKTLLTLALIGSFLRRGHFALHIDAERVTPITWVREVLGALADSPRYFADRPETYEKTVDAVAEFLENVKGARDAKEVHEATSAIVVVDSLRKLMPEDILKKIVKEGASGEKGSIDGMGGRAAQIRAAMNSSWFDTLVFQLEKGGANFTAIVRETEDPNADVWAKKFGNDYKVGGGKSVIYEAGIVLRTQRDSWIVDERNGGKQVIGERHRMTIKKTKVGGKESRETVAFFHSSNGVFLPPGLDRARDVLDLARRFRVVDGFSWQGTSLGRSEHAAVKAMAENPELLASIEVATREEFTSNKPEEQDAAE